jgi:uncharacterized damage-inducible protein DinB
MDTLLEEALDAWTDARTGVIDEVENVPGGKFDFRPVPEMRNVSELVVHILEVSLMMAGELAREDTNFQRLPFPRLVAEYASEIQQLRSKRDLLSALRRTLKEGTKKFRDVGELHMLQHIVRFDGQKGTRFAWLHHGISQEMYHRGQLAVYERLMGIKPALTARIDGSA